MNDRNIVEKRDGERGAALVLALLMMTLLLAMTMGMSMTAVSELGVSSTYSNQTQAFQAAEAGLYHGLSLVKNFDNHSAGGDPSFTKLLLLRDANGTYNPEMASIYSKGNNPFTDSTMFATGCVMINTDGQPLLSAKLDGLGNQLAVPGVTYAVHLVDDEKSDAGITPYIRNFDLTSAWEDKDPKKDTNNRLVMYSTGTYASSSVTLEGWVGFVPYPALVAQDNIQIGGNSKIEGAYGGVHSNSNLDVGASAYIQQTATASGNFTQSGGGSQIDGFHAGGQPALYIPKFVTNAPLTSGGPNTAPRIQDYIIRKADRLLLDPDYARATGSETLADAQTRVNSLEDRLNVTHNSIWTAMNTSPADPKNEQAISITRDGYGVGTATSIPSVSTTGWKYNNANGWDIAGSGFENHTFYIVGRDNYSANKPNGGNAKITTNLGTAASPLKLSVLATGSIETTSNPSFEANLTGLQTLGELPPFVTINLLFVTVEDVKIRGDVDVPHFSGIIYAGEQFDLSGNGAFDGQVIGLSNKDVSASLVSANSVSGSFELTFNGGQSVGTVKLMSWRQIKQ